MRNVCYYNIVFLKMFGFLDLCQFFTTPTVPEHIIKWLFPIAAIEIKSYICT